MDKEFVQLKARYLDLIDQYMESLEEDRKQTEAYLELIERMKKNQEHLVRYLALLEWLRSCGVKGWGINADGTMIGTGIGPSASPVEVTRLAVAHDKTGAGQPRRTGRKRRTRG